MAFLNVSTRRSPVKQQNSNASRSIRRTRSPVQCDDFAFRLRRNVRATRDKRNASRASGREMKPVDFRIVVWIVDMDPACESRAADVEAPSRRMLLNGHAEARIAAVCNAEIGKMKSL